MIRAYLLTLSRSATLLALLFAALFVSTSHASEPRLSISGYDPVAYFTDGKAVQGKAELEYVWPKLRWRFASGEHRELFIKDPAPLIPSACHPSTTTSITLSAVGVWSGKCLCRFPRRPNAPCGRMCGVMSATREDPSRSKWSSGLQVVRNSRATHRR